MSPNFVICIPTTVQNKPYLILRTSKAHSSTEYATFRLTCINSNTGCRSISQYVHLSTVVPDVAAIFHFTFSHSSTECRHFHIQNSHGFNIDRELGFPDGGLSDFHQTHLTDIMILEKPRQFFFVI
jgi:hypothetical protein